MDVYPQTHYLHQDTLWKLLQIQGSLHSVFGWATFYSWPGSHFLLSFLFMKQRRIPNPLSKARDWTHIVMDTSQICFHYTTMETPLFFFFFGCLAAHGVLDSGIKSKPQPWQCRSLTHCVKQGLNLCPNALETERQSHCEISHDPISPIFGQRSCCLWTLL